MSDRKNIEYEIFEKLENATTKIAQKVFDVLNREGIAGIIADTRNNVFWFEYYSSGNNCPAYVYQCKDISIIDCRIYAVVLSTFKLHSIIPPQTSL